MLMSRMKARLAGLEIVYIDFKVMYNQDEASSDERTIEIL